MIPEILFRNPLKTIGVLVCASALIGAVWFFSRTNSSEQSIPTATQPVPLFAQGLKIEQTPTSISVEKPLDLQKPAPKSAIDPLSNEEIEQTLLKYQRQYQNCWTLGLKTNPQLSGRVLVHMTISTNGKVSNVEVPQTDIEDATMIQCLKSVIHRIPFREFGGNPITLSLPLDFTY